MKKFVFCYLITFVFISGQSFSQDTTGVEEKIVPAPQRMETEKEEKVIPERKLPTIDMKEFIITGKEEIKLEPAEKSLEVSPEILKGEEETVSDIPEAIPRKPFEDTGVKYTKAIIIPEFEEGNFFHITYGRYNELDIGAQIEKVYKNDNILIGGDFRRTSGFRENADMYKGMVSFNDFHKFTEGITGVLGLDYTQGMYKFYGSHFYSDVERNTKFLNGMFQTNFRRWASWDIGLEAGGRIGKIDDIEDSPERGLNGRFSVKKIAGSSLIKGEIFYDGEFLNRDDEWSRIDLLKGNFEIEGNIRNVFRLKVGVNVFNVTDTADEKLTRFYPYASLANSIPGLGEIYGEFAPDVSIINMITALNKNRYIRTHTNFSYVDTPLSLKVGWKNRKLQNFNWEVYYLFQKFENFGIEHEVFPGLWWLRYNYKTQLQGIRFLMNWQQSDVLTLWASAGVLDYSKLEFNGYIPQYIIGNVPYHPNVSGDFTLDISPGGGVKFELTGRYVGERFIHVFGGGELDPYFLADMTIGIRLSKKIAISAKIFNLFNQKYETRSGYDQPDMVSAGDISYYW